MKNRIKRAAEIWSLDDISTDDSASMVWISGPRQVGKTYMVHHAVDGEYFNWDTVEVRKNFAKDPYFFRSEHKLVIFDEIHKRRGWKKLIKGYYDSPHRQENFIVTGSGKLDVYRKGGDSLQGRYQLYTLNPLVFDEINPPRRQYKAATPRDWQNWKPDSCSKSDHELIQLGGFPQPFLDGSERKLRRWQDMYLDRLVREDTRDFSDVKKIDQLELMARLLPERVGSPLSHLSISRDIETSVVAVKSWLRLIELLYLGFQISPYHRKIHRAVKKEKKWYFYQWTFVQDKALRFENYIAVQLKTACDYWTEQGYGKYELCYLRDQDRREIDFVICRDLKPIALIEAKNSFQSWTNALHHFSERLGIPGILVYPDSDADRVKRVNKTGWVLPSSRLLKGLVLSIL